MSLNKLPYLANKLFRLNWNGRNFPVLILLSIMLAVFMFGMNTYAEWWVIDDHEILFFLGADHVVKGNEIIAKFLQDTEIGQYLQVPRFRPVYYAFRLLEAWLWGAKPSLWYALRIFIFASFITSFCYLISQRVGGVIGTFISLFVGTQKYWADIFGRLGPSESYAALGLALFGWGIHTVYKSDKAIGWWCLFAGSVICAGAKENFVFLFLPLSYVVWDFYDRGKLSLMKAIPSFGAGIWMIWIGTVVFISAQSVGGDVYTNSIGLRDRLSILIRLFGRGDVIALSVICLSLVFLKRLIFVNTPSFSQDLKEAIASATILTLVYISQIFIYNGEWPIGTRYDFPGVLVGPLMLVVLIVFFHRWSAQNNYVRINTGIILLSTFGVFVVAVFSLGNLTKIREITNQNVDRTVAFTKKIEHLAVLGIQNPNHVLIIQADNPIWDYEPVFSYSRFFRFLGVKNKISFLWAGRKPETYRNELGASLANDLRNLSYYAQLPILVAGNEDDFTPYPEVDGSDANCILFVISGEPQKECSIMVQSNWR